MQVGDVKMSDIIIWIVALFIVAVAVGAILKKSKSKASCCGSGTYVAKSRKLKSIVQKKSFRVDGMHCQNCVNRVMEDVQDIPHSSAKVNLKQGIVTVSMEEPIDENEIKAAIEKHGYVVVETI